MSDSRDSKPFRWGFATAAAAILVLVCIGQAAGVALSEFGPEDASGPIDFVRGMHAKDWLFVAFAISSAVFVWLQRASVVRFFRSMHVGVSLVALSGIAIVVGVLVPQIDNFEDPTERVPSLAGIPAESVESYLASPKRAADEDPRLRPDDNPILAKLAPEQALRLKGWRAQYEAFRWAEGYFLYHLSHGIPVYGWFSSSMPKGELPPQVHDSLARFGDRYGGEEQKNREIEMKAAFSGREKTAAIGQLIGEHETGIRRAFQVCTALQLNRAYKSSWFTSLLALLGIGIFFNTFRTSADRLLSIKKVGFFTVHIGVMTILVGGFISRHRTDRGILHLDTTEGPTDTYWAYGSSDKKMRMPFAVKADRFARKDWPTLELGFNGDQFRSRLPEYTVWPGFTKDLDFETGADGVRRPRIHLEVLSIASRADVRMPRFFDAEKRDDPNGQGPLAELSVRTEPVGDAAPEERPALLKPDYPARDSLFDPEWKFRLRCAYGADASALLRELATEDAKRLGYLHVRSASAGDVDSDRVPFQLGQKIQIAGGYTVEVQEATASFQLDPTGKGEIRDARPLAEQFPRSPAVWVNITRADGSAPERRLLLEALDWEAHGRQKKFSHADLVLQLEWERWTSPGPPRFILLWGPSGSPELLAEDGARTPVAVGGTLALPGPTRVTVAHLHHNVLYEKQIDFVAPHIQGPTFDADFYAKDPMGLEVAVTSYPGTPKEHRDVVRMASTDESLANVWTDPEQRFWVRFFGNDKALPFEWRSVLSVWKKDADGKLYRVDLGREQNREVRVNDYLYYEGYRFFQTNALPELPTYSGIGVVYDPGIPVVLMGMYLTIVGAAIAFIVRPIVEGRRARRSAGSTAQEATA
ncbi:MAG TPA: hypothetical protein VGR31_01555 [Planctomycetota bacterium]|jgi:hypothetical protein|nr:hypothetical protein [Planctomycetota bacterium]